MARKTDIKRPDVLDIQDGQLGTSSDDNAVAEKPLDGYNIGRGLRSVYPARIHIDGSVTGKPYRWEQPGDVVFVDELDYDDLLSREIGGRGGCCGGSSGRNKLFEAVN